MSTLVPHRSRRPGAGGEGLARGERGQVVVFLVVAMLALLGMAALAIDVGHAFLVKRRAQAAADASALAAAQQLPQTVAATAASAELATSNFPAGSIGLTFSGTYTANDTANTHASATFSSFFANVVGIGSFTAGARASAVIASYTGWASNVAPWVTDRASISWGQQMQFKVEPGDQASPGNFGGVDLPVREAGCGFASGASDYRDLIASRTHSCLVRTGELLPVETGNKGGNTGRALGDRGATNGFDPFQLLRQQPNGRWEITNTSHPNVVVIPVVAAFHKGSSAPFLVTGVAWFIITAFTPDTVTGMFVQAGAAAGALCATASNPNAPCPVGPYNPDGFNFIRLTA